MNIISLENITKIFTERKIFDDTSFFLEEGEKVGIIGINGTGKSTLLKIMAGQVQAEQGNCVRSNNIVVSFLPQNPIFVEGKTIMETVISIVEAHAKRHALHVENDWETETDAKTILTKLGVSDFSKEISTLSGGERKRVALTAALITKADVLLLDEPTNHLDSTMADWLEDYLKKYRGAIVMITHDRYFLDSVTTRIVELDKGKLFSYDANYTGYLSLKAAREDMEWASQRKRQSLLRVELEWMQRGARARATKQKAHIQRFEDLRDTSAPEVDGKVELSSISTRLGKTTIELHHISKAYGEKELINDFSYIFLPGDRIGIVGENGSGKTTLMNIIMGNVQPDVGHVIIGQTVKIGYFAQEVSLEKKTNIGKVYMNPNQKVIDYVKEIAEYVDTPEGKVSASTMLEKFLFPANVQYNLLGKLSGGEKRRLQLLRVLMEAPNVLLLDEPTNDLDITTLTILEDYLDHFAGIVVIISHDRYFLDRVVRRIFALKDSFFRQFEGGYSQYQNTLQEEQDCNVESKRKGTNTIEQKNGEDRQEFKDKNKKLKFSYMEQKDYESIETQIATLEAIIEEIDQKTTQVATDFVKLNDLTKKREEAKAKLEEKMQRWMYLEDLAEKIQEQENL